MPLPRSPNTISPNIPPISRISTTRIRTRPIPARSISKTTTSCRATTRSIRFWSRGAPAPDIQNLMFDTLMQRSWDELASEYALIADDVEVAPDLTSATFHINPAARFSNGDPITAADVKYSLDTLKSPQASPLLNSQFSVIKSATVLDKSTDPLRFRASGARCAADCRRSSGVLAEMGHDARRQAAAVRPDFDRAADCERSVSDRAAQERQGHRVSAQSELLGRESAVAPRDVPLRSDSLQALP